MLLAGTDDLRESLQSFTQYILSSPKCAFDLCYTGNCVAGGHK